MLSTHTERVPSLDEQASRSLALCPNLTAVTTNGGKEYSGVWIIEMEVIVVPIITCNVGTHSYYLVK